ncbi:Anaphase-promoting complex subunit 1 [Coemansia guatemalensis]|uniref:Anaphase-promoting complex subunit 1 n=1 Tax=Coemansia guatemalensis TaxID=2761395 RepID=A0A9W8HY71_9FUNG|nr:Anaphase-promoting complex subunit 1 [Coemansia guatemalensis]
MDRSTRRLVAVLDDAVTGNHKAHVAETTISWTVDERFVRSFRLDSVIRQQETVSAADHIVFARFREADAPRASAVAVALCVFRVDMLTIHYYSGEAFSVSLPFGVRSVYALYTGLLVQRTDASDAGAFAISLPTLFSLLGPRSEFKMLGLSRSPDPHRMRAHQQGRQLLLSPTPSRVEGPGSSIPVFNEPNIVLVSTATSRHDPTVQFVLCWDSAARRHLVYQCAVADQSLESEVDTSADAGSGTDSSASQLSAAGIGQLSASRPRMTRQSSLSVQRRSSAAASAAAMAAAVSKRKSGYASAVKKDRRSSMLGRVSFNDSPGPNYAADIFREQRQMKAEVILHLCWGERRNRGDSRKGDGSNARICVIQSTLGEDVVCVLNADVDVVIGLDTTNFEEIFRLPARSVAPVPATCPTFDDLLVVSPSGSLHLALGDGGRPIALRHICCKQHIASIEYTDSTFAALEVAGHNEHLVVDVCLRISRLARAIASALSFVLSRQAFCQLWRCFVVSLPHAEDAYDEMTRVTSLLLHGNDRSDPPATLPARVRSELRDRAPAAMYVLRLVYEDAVLYKAEPVERLAAMGRLLSRFALHNCQLRAYQALLCTGLRPSDNAEDIEPPSGRQRSVDRDPAIVPSLVKWALGTLDPNGKRVLSFPALNHTSKLFDVADAMPSYGAQSSLRLLNVVTDILYQLSAGRDPALVLRRLANHKSPMALLRQLTLDMQWLIYSIISRTRLACSPSWPTNVLALFGRHDIIANMSEGATNIMSLRFPASSVKAIGDNAGGHSAADISAGGSHGEGLAETQDIAEMCEGIIEHHHSGTGASCPKRSVQSQEFAALAFGRDLRLDEAERLLSMSAVTYTANVISNNEPIEDAEDPREQFMAILARRVLALPLGQSLLGYSTHVLNPQDALAINHPKVSVRFRGSKTETTWDPVDTDTSWSLFHSGVSAALSIERDQLRDVHPSWVLLNWPAEPSPDVDMANNKDAQKTFNDSLALHAGFLLGVGLLTKEVDSVAGDNTLSSSATQQQRNGPLCNMPPWQAFEYLSRRHGLTSIALLLGCACAHRGTGNSSVSKILSLHIPNLLPPGSSELMLLSYGTQAAAILGIGLLFMRSQNRRMVEVILRELETIKWSVRDTSSDRINVADPAESTAECYSLAAGFALGLVVLGGGISSRTLADLRLLDALTETINGSASGGISRSRDMAQTFDLGDVDTNESRYSGRESTLGLLGRLNISASSGDSVSNLGAIAALGLVFLGTNYSPAAERLALPETQRQLGSADPFVLLWKTLMRSLIMLDSIMPTTDWVESRVPRTGVPAEGELLPLDLYRARLHIVSAACFAISLKYAGSEDRSAHETILSYFDEIEVAANKPSLGYESSLTRAAAQSCLDILCIAAALVIAGSGDIATMKRLRALHGASAGRTYGNHMASHMALGILFLGNGARFTISRSLESIALLLISFFPRFPHNYADNREHLQAWRHLWALCVVPRCLVVRDVVTGDMCRHAVATIIEDPMGDSGSQAVQLAPPMPFGLLSEIRSIHVQAPGYLPLQLDLPPKSYARDLLFRRRVLFMQPLNQPALAISDATPGLVSQKQYFGWLANVQARVANACTKLVQSDYQDSGCADISSVIRGIEHLRICAQASQSSFVAHTEEGSEQVSKNRSPKSWAEATFLTWLSVHKTVVDLGRNDRCRRIITRYWTGNQLPEHPAENMVVALLYSVLDLPSPSDAMRIAKQLPMSQLVDHFIR